MKEKRKYGRGGEGKVKENLRGRVEDLVDEKGKMDKIKQ